MRNEDIQRFWSQTRSLLDKVAINEKTEEIPLSDPMIVDTHVRTRTVHEVVLTSFGDVRIRAWYSVPAGEPPRGGWPAIMELPPYKEQMPLPLHLGMHGFATLSLFPRGQGLSRKESQVEVDTKVVNGIEDREKYYYRGAYMDCVRGIDFLSSRSELDGNRIGTWGFSAGGGLSLATASLDSRVKAAAASVPWPCDFRSNAQASNPPFVRVREYIERNPDKREQALKTLDYFDIVNLVDSIQCPVLIGGAIADDLHPIGSTLLAYERIKSRKGTLIYPDLTHEYRSDFTFNALSWMKRHL
jgi:cephalosporin-C deacetylase